MASNIDNTREPPPKRVMELAILEKQYDVLKLKKRYLESQNEAKNAPLLTRIESEIDELRLKLDVVDLEATLASKGLGDVDNKVRQEELDKKRGELIKHQEKIKRAQAGPVVGEKKE